MIKEIEGKTLETTRGDFKMKHCDSFKKAIEDGTILRHKLLNVFMIFNRVDPCWIEIHYCPFCGQIIDEIHKELNYDTFSEWLKEGDNKNLTLDI